MAEENTSEVKENEKGFDTNPPAMMSEESSVETVLVKDVENVEDVKSVVSKDQEECIPEVSKEVPKPQGGNLRRHSTGTIGKPQVQSRYRGNHRVASTHDLCKHGKRCDQDDVVKPWKNVRRKSVESSEETRKSLGSANRQSPVTKPESSVAAKRDVLIVKRKPCGSVNSESSSTREGSEMSRSVNGSSVKSNDKARKKKETGNTLSGSGAVKKVSPGLRNEKSSAAIEIRADGGSSKVCAPKNKEKAKIQTISGEDVKEKTVCVVESSVQGVRSEKQPLSEKKIGHKSLTTTPKRGSANQSPTRQIPGNISTGLNMKKESGSGELEANPKPEKKIRPKRTGVKVTQAKQLSFKRGKVLEPKPEDSSSPTWIKFKKRVVQEQKTETEGKKKKKKNLKVLETKSDACESSKREKVVLRHRKVEGKKKMITLFNNVIEEAMNKLTKVRKSKVKALVGAFETVISLQETTKTSQKPQSKATTSASKVSPEQ